MLSGKVPENITIVVDRENKNLFVKLIFVYLNLSIVLRNKASITMSRKEYSVFGLRPKQHRS